MGQYAGESVINIGVFVKNLIDWDDVDFEEDVVNIEPWVILLGGVVCFEMWTNDNLLVI